MGNNQMKLDSKNKRLKKTPESNTHSLEQLNTTLAAEQWRVAKLKHSNLGTEAIVNFLTEYPQWAGKLGVGTLDKVDVNNPTLAGLGLKIENFLSSFIEMTENDHEAAKTQCRTLGRMHFYLNVNFDVELFETFKYHILAIVEPQSDSDQTNNNSEHATNGINGINNNTVTADYHDSGEEEKRYTTPWNEIIDFIIGELMHGIVHESLAKQILAPHTSDGKPSMTSGSSGFNSEDTSALNSRSASLLSLNYTGLDSSRSRPTSRRRLSADVKNFMKPFFSKERKYSMTENERKRSDSLISQHNNELSHKNSITLMPHKQSRSQTNSVRRKKKENKPVTMSSETPAVMTLDERMLLRKLWVNKDHETIGQAIIIDLFESKPILRRYFGLPDDPDLNLYDCVIVKVHGCRLHGFLHNIIMLLMNEKNDRAIKLTRRVGKMHFHRGVDFTADNWLAFKRTIIKHFVKDIPSGVDSTNAYIVVEKMLRFITSHMKQGFLAVALGGSVEKQSNPTIASSNAEIANSTDITNSTLDNKMSAVPEGNCLHATVSLNDTTTSEYLAITPVSRSLSDNIRQSRCKNGLVETQCSVINSVGDEDDDDDEDNVDPCEPIQMNMICDDFDEITLTFGANDVFL